MDLRAAAGGAELGSDSGRQAGLGAQLGDRPPSPSAGADSLAGLTGWVGHVTHVTGGIQGRLTTELSLERKPEAGLGVGAVGGMERVGEEAHPYPGLEGPS